MCRESWPPGNVSRHLLHGRVADAGAHARSGVAARARLAARRRLGPLRPEAGCSCGGGKRKGRAAGRVLALAVPQLPGVLQRMRKIIGPLQLHAECHAACMHASVCCLDKSWRF